MIKKKAVIFLRKLLKVSENETINSAINRKKVKAKKKVYKKNISVEDLSRSLKEIGIKKGDNLMVHASWREFFNFLGSPEDIIRVLQSLIGDEGTLLMPAYGNDRKYLDVDNTPSSAGVLSEVFRQQPNTFRSECTHFSTCAWGKNAESLTNTHFRSEYGFDSYSPYYKFSEIPNNKVLFLGLGKEPTQISLFHCAGYILKDKKEIYSKLLSFKYTAILEKKGEVLQKSMIIRKPGHPNNNKVFKKIFRSLLNKKHIKLKNIDIVVIDAAEGLRRAVEFGENNQYCYKNMRKL